MTKQEKIKRISELIDYLKIGYNEGLNNVEINEKEKLLNVVFPDDYKELIKIYGWLCVGEGYIGGNLGVNETIKLREYFPDKFPKNLIPVNDDGRGNYYCLVCGGKDNGKIIFWQHDVDDNEVYPNIPKDEKEDFWIDSPDLWTWLLNYLEEEKRSEDEWENE